MKVLIVEDNEDNRNLLTKQFRAFGHEIKTASNGAEALKQALEDMPDILVSDIQMPEMDGYQLCREWKQNDKLKDIPVVFYTATYTSAEDEKFALDLGVNAFIRKPTEPDVLIKILSGIIDRAGDGMLSPPAVEPLAQYEYLEEHNRRLVTKLQKKVEDLNLEVGERKKTEAALRASEERFRGTLDAMLEGYQIIGYDWRYLYINPVAAVQGHYDRNRYYEHTMMELYPGIKETDMFRAIQKCMQENRPDRIENEFTYPDGTKAWFDLRIEPVPEGILVLSVDISKRKKAESDVKRINRMLRTISECNQLLVRAKDEKELLDRICDLVVKSEGFPLAWVGFAVNDEEKTVRPVALSGSAIAYLDNLKISWADNEFGRGPTGVAIRTGKPCIARHGMTDSSFPRWRASAAKYGFNASIALPLVSNGTTIGSLNIYSKDEDAFNEGQVNLLTELTDDLAYGITVLRKRRELAIANESLAQSEKKYSTLVEQSNDGVIVIRNGEIKFANKQIMKMTGFSMEETIGKKLFDFVSPRYKEVVIERYTRRMAGEDVLNRYEVEIATKNGRHIPVEINAGIIEHEGQTADMAIIRDITERKKAEETLKESEAKYRLLVENIPVGVCIVYGNRILFANSQDEKISGYTLEELQAIDPFNVIYEEDRNKVAEYAAMRARGESAPDTYNLRIIRKDGTLRWLRRNVLQIDWLGERATLVLDTDITESHKAEEALKESEAKYRLLVDNIPVGVAIMRGGKILFANSQNEQMSGYTIEELKSLNPFAVVYEEDRARVAEYAAMRARGEPVPSSYEVRIIRKDGSLRWLRRSVVLIDWLGEKASLIIDSDITERKKAEEGLIKSEERFRQVADSADEWIWEINAEGKYTYSSPAVEKILGYTPEEIVGKKHFYDFYPEDVREEFTKTSMAVAEQKQPFRSFANPNVHKNGTIVILDTNAAPILDKDGNLLGYRGVDMDITERIKAEEALKESEHFLDNIIEHTPNSMWISDSSGTIIRINQALRDLLKITDESVVGKYNVFKDKQVIEQGLLPLVESVFKEGKTVNFTIDYYTERESQIESEEKTHKIIDIVMSAVRDKDGKVVNGICQHKDVTAQKQAEEALKESEERYRAFAESTHEIIQSIGTDGSILFVNKAWHNILGYSEEDLNAITLEDIIHPDSLEHCSNMFREVISGKYFPFVEAKFKKKDGSIVYVEGSAAPRFLGDKVIATQGFYSDVTERKIAEEALKKEKEYAQNIVNTAQTIILSLDAEGRIVDFNPYMTNVSGYTIDESRGKDWFDTFLPERNREKTRKVFKQAKKIINPESNIDVIVTKNGKERFIEWHFISIKDNEGKTIGVLSTGQDITERKEAEEALKDEATRRRILIEQSRDGIVILNQNGGVYEANQRFAEMLGYKPSEMVKLHVWDWEYLSSREQLVDMLRTVDEKGDYFETKHRRKDGSIYDVEISTNGAIFAGQKLIFCVCRDITERKKAEDELRESQHLFSTVANTSPALVWMSGTDKLCNWFNEPWLNFTGRTMEQEMGNGWAEGVHPDDLAGCIDTYVKAFDSRQPFSMEYRLRYHDGEYRWIIDNGTPRFDARGNFIGYIGSCLDISERREAEEKIRISEEKYRTLFETMAQGVVYQNREGEIISANKAAEHILGLTLSQMQGKTSFDPSWHAIHEDGSPFPGDEHPAVVSLKTGKAVGDVVMGVFNIREKGYRWIVINAIPQFRENEKEAYQVYTTFNDITQIKQIEKALIQSESKLRESLDSWETTFNSMNDSICLLALDGTIIRCNQAMNELVGKPGENIINQKCYKLVHGSENYIEGCPHLKMLESGHREELECMIGEKWLHTVVDPIFDDKGAMTGSVHIMEDITERKKMEERMIMTDRLASIGELSSGIAHELNNPLTSVIGIIQLLMERGDIPDDILKDLQLVNSEGQRAARVVKNLLVFARKHPNQAQLSSVNQAVEKVLELRAYDQKVNNIQVIRDFAEELPQVLMDYFQIQQVFLNIVINAEFAMKEANNGGTLVIKTELAGEMVRVSFKDDGPGISAENLKRIFNPFFTTKEVGKGTGLGLSICHGIIAQHHGNIYAESKPGKGATFVVELPVNPPEETGEGNNAENR